MPVISDNLSFRFCSSSQLIRDAVYGRLIGKDGFEDQEDVVASLCEYVEKVANDAYEMGRKMAK